MKGTAEKLGLRKKIGKEICEGCGKEFIIKRRHGRELCLRCVKKRWEYDNLKNGKERKKQWFQRNPEYLRQYVRRPEVKKRIYRYFKRLRKENPKFRLDLNICNLIRQSLKGKKAGRNWEKLVGYTLKDLIEHLEKHFDDKMGWENYGNYWHIDHIKPRSLFTYTAPEESEFKECWSLKNLQPLEKISNLRKSNTFVPESSYNKEGVMLKK